MTVQIQVLPNPYQLDWKNWAFTVVGFNIGLINEVDPDDRWDEFARRLCQVVPQAPQPDSFPTWQDWAAALKSVLHV